MHSSCRERDEISRELSILEPGEFSDKTGCLKPCHYKRYILLGGHKMKSDDYKFSLLAVSSTTRVENEKLIYPMSSLVAEFGGTLSLFLGFSFISLWDNIDILKKLLAFIRQNV